MAIPLADQAGPLPLPPTLGQPEGGVDPDSPEGEEAGGLDGLLRLVYRVDQALDAVARQYPRVASKIDTVKASLQDVVATATRSGAAPPKKRGLSAISGDKTYPV